MNTVTKLPRRAMATVTGLFAFTLLTTACATNPEPVSTVSTGEVIESGVAVRVNNDLTPPTTLTVGLLPNTGVVDLIGTVSPSDAKTLTFMPRVPAGPYRLQAETSMGTVIMSREFVLGNSDRIEWDLSSNTVRVFNTK